MKQPGLGWFGIVRLGLVQTALGAIVVLATSVINRVMVVELALPAIVPGALVAFHYLIQVLRPRFGHGSDQAGRRTRWIIGGMAILCAGGVMAALAVDWMTVERPAGIALAVIAFSAIGIGVGACGTSLLVLLAKQTAEARRPAAATLVWLMMIAGFVITTALVGSLLDPFSFHRLLEVAAAVSAIAMLVTVIAVHGIEGRREPGSGPNVLRPAHAPFATALRQVWRDAEARRLTLFIFVSMLAYSAEELVIDPFSGTVFGFTPGQSTHLSSALHAGVFMGMVALAVCASIPLLARRIPLRVWMMIGCMASAFALFGLAWAGMAGPGWPLRQTVMALGFANGLFTISAVATMMNLAGRDGKAHEGVRMGLWGAAQAIAFGIGGLSGSAASDLARHFIGSPGAAYALVFAGQALLFIGASGFAAQMSRPATSRRSLASAGQTLFAARIEQE